MNNPVISTPETQKDIQQMEHIRISYRKTGRAKYISHLDIVRFMQRALKRAKLPVWYTQGFHPHMYLTFALPLPLGYESVCEYMDFRLEQLIPYAQIQSDLNATLPPDIQVIHVGKPRHKFQEICKAAYDVVFFSDTPAGFEDAYDTFCAQPCIMTTKRTKKGQITVDLKPEFCILQKKALEHQLTYQMLFSAGQKNFNPSLMIDAFFSAHPEYQCIYHIIRQKLLVENGSVFE